MQTIPCCRWGGIERETGPVALVLDEFNWHGCQDKEMHNKKLIHNETFTVQFVQRVMWIKLYAFFVHFDVLTVVLQESGNNNFTIILKKKVKLAHKISLRETWVIQKEHLYIFTYYGSLRHNTHRNVKKGIQKKPPTFNHCISILHHNSSCIGLILLWPVCRRLLHSSQF